MGVVNLSSFPLNAVTLSSLIARSSMEIKRSLPLSSGLRYEKEGSFSHAHQLFSIHAHGKTSIIFPKFSWGKGVRSLPGFAQ